MNDPKIVEDGFYEDCLELSRTNHQKQELRIALVSKGGQQGLDIRKFRASDGRPTTGIMLDVEQAKILAEIIKDSDVMNQLINAGSINFDNYKEEN